MALSGVYDTADTVAELISDAMSVIGAKQGNDTVAAEDQALGIRTLRAMLRTWAADGIRLWINATQSVTLVAGTATYTLSPRTLEVFGGVRRTVSGTDTTDVPIRIVTREEYMRYPNKTSSGSPLAVFVDRQRATTTVTTWPVASATDVSQTMTLRLETKRQVQDPTAANEDADIPPEWMETVIYNLGVRMAGRLGLAVDPAVAQIAGALYEKMSGQDREGSVTFRLRRR